jgi:hypothetical protein
MTEPRFHIRLDEGDGRLELASPLPVGPLSLEALELSLGPVAGTVDLGAGAAGFRHRRSRVLRARVRIPTKWLEEDLQVRPAAVRVDGCDLRVAASEALAQGLDGLGHVQALRDGGELRIVRPLRALLVEAMVPHGWRVPEDGEPRLRVHDGGGAVHIEAERGI